jgi:hypothetical protein
MDTCPACERFHDSPGPTARFHAFVEEYAGEEAEEDRRAMYTLRSTFVRGRLCTRLTLHGPGVLSSPPG